MKCVCGEPATVTVEVEWANGVRQQYRYCASCADAITFSIEGAEEVPS